ncbi:hypothetical protein K4L44_02680 [Halosquirtibacter laminarini]|uniref:Uncharacterized protein n=1 Tax=Halosquirtibacter laminarini TaxID=3374600 RepID=A0AC61NR59_9BACT|nr:hypothetical protein K4L44_02680 [Prolixibacteraceae bacterium]
MKKISIFVVLFVFAFQLAYAEEDENISKELCKEIVSSPINQDPYEKPRRRKIRSEYYKRSIWENRINIQGGVNWNKFSGMLTNTSQQGYSGEASFYHFIFESLGVGVETSYTSVLLDQGKISYEDKATEHLIDQNFNHQTSVLFVAPGVITRTTAFSNRMVFYAGLGVGYAMIDMKDNNKTEKLYDINFRGIATKWRAGFDISLAEKVYLNVEGYYFRVSSSSFYSLLDGKNHKFDLKDGQYTRLENYGVNMGLVFCF